MPNTQITMLSAVDQAVEKLPFLRRRITQRHFRRNPVDKYEVTERAMLAMTIFEGGDIEEMCPGICDGFETGAITASTPFNIDLDNLERFLQIIIEYLPQILDIVLKILPLFISSSDE